MDKSSFSSKTRKTHALQRMIMDNLRYMASTKVEHASRLAKHCWQNTLHRPSPAHSNAPLSRKMMNVIWVLIAVLMQCENSKKFGVSRGVEHDLQNTNELQR
jgi:hypothetical protein